MTRGWVVAVAAVVVLVGSPSSAESQIRRRAQGPKAQIGLAFIAAEPIGELGAFFNEGFGGQLGVGFPVDEFGLFRIVADVGFLIYGYEHLSFCSYEPYGCRILTDLTTTNNIVFGGLGPELAVPLGVVEPYVRATMGFSYWFTHSSVSGNDDYHDYGNTTNYSDWVPAWRAGAGLRLRIVEGSKPVSIDLGVEHHANGVADFLTEGDIVDHPDGSISIFPNRSEAKMITYRIGVSIGIPRDRH